MLLFVFYVTVFLLLFVFFAFVFALIKGSESDARGEDDHHESN